MDCDLTNLPILGVGVEPGNEMWAHLSRVLPKAVKKMKKVVRLHSVLNIFS